MIYPKQKKNTPSRCHIASDWNRFTTANRRALDSRLMKKRIQSGEAFQRESYGAVDFRRSTVHILARSRGVFRSRLKKESFFWKIILIMTLHRLAAERRCGCVWWTNTVSPSKIKSSQIQIRGIWEAHPIANVGWEFWANLIAGCLEIILCNHLDLPHLPKRDRLWICVSWEFKMKIHSSCSG